MIRILSFITVAVGLVLAPAAFAQQKEPESPVTEMSFDGDVVEADFLRPDQGVAEGLIRKKKNSLIKLRTDFVDEILKSAEDL